MWGAETPTTNIIEQKEELGNKVLSAAEQSSCKAIVDYVKNSKINLMEDETNKKETLLDKWLQKVILEKLGHNVNIIQDNRIDIKEQKENDNFFGLILYDIKSEYDNISKDDANKVEKEKSFLDMAKTFLLLKWVKDHWWKTNPYRWGMDDKFWEEQYASIEKCLKYDLAESRPKLASALQENYNEKNKTEIKSVTWYETKQNSDGNYSINGQLTGDEAIKFKESFTTNKLDEKYNLDEKIIDNREPGTAVKDKYNLPENIINVDLTTLDNLPWFKELNDKIKDKENYKIKSIDITGISSYIPTDLTSEIRTYLWTKGINVPENTPENKPGNNDYLAKARALICQDRVNAKLKENNYTEEAVKVTINSATGVTWEAWDENFNNPSYKDASGLSRTDKYWPSQGAKFNIELDEYKPKYEYTLKAKTELGIPEKLPYEKFNMEIVIPKVLKDKEGKVYDMSEILSKDDPKVGNKYTDFRVLHYDSDQRNLHTTLGEKNNPWYSWVNTQASGDSGTDKDNVYAYMNNQKSNYVSENWTEAVYKPTFPNVLLISTYEDYLEYAKNIRKPGNILTDKQLSEYFETKLTEQKTEGIDKKAQDIFTLVNEHNVDKAEEWVYTYSLDGKKHIYGKELEALKKTQE